MGLLAQLGEPRRRRHAAAGPGHAEANREHKRPRIGRHVLLMALVGCVVVSMITFNSTSSTPAAHGLQRAGGRRQTVELEVMVMVQQHPGAASAAASASKRHRKLEHGTQLADDQVALAATIDSGTGLPGGDASAAAAAADQAQGASGAAAAAAAGVQAGSAVASEGAAGDADRESGSAGDGAEGGAASDQDFSDVAVDEEDAEDVAEMQLDDALAQREKEEQAAEALWEAEAEPGDGEVENAVLAAAADTAAAASGQQAQAGQQQGQQHGEQGAQQVPAEQQPQQEEQPGGAGLEMGAAGGQPRRRKSPYQKALEKCESLACLTEAAKLKRHPGQFRFPHFLIIGWQKCATTSLFHHLVLHPNVQCPSEKEPEFFSYECQYDPLNCPLDKQREYIQETLHINRLLRHNLYRATMDGSTHYAREGQRMAKGLRELFPWVKLVASMREPISRGISMLAHNLDRSSIGCLTKRDVFECLQRDLPGLNYTAPFSAWLDAFPKEQIMLLQYESLTNPEHTTEHLQAMKTFLELNPSLPATDLEHSNSRESRLGRTPEGWPMKRLQYEKLVDLVRPDAERIAALVTEHGLGDGKRWMNNWEKAWQANFNSCTLDGDCVIQLS